MKTLSQFLVYRFAPLLLAGVGGFIASEYPAAHDAICEVVQLVP